MADLALHEVGAVSKALRILKLFSHARPELTLREISKELGLPKSTAHRLVVTLEGAGFVEQVEGTNRYRLGMALFRLGSIVHERLDLSSVAPPVMRALSQETSETVVLVVRCGLERMCIEKVDGPRHIRPFVKVGDPLPLHAGASGLVLLAYMQPEEVERVIAEKGLYRLTPNTITDPATLDEVLERVRRDGYAISRGDRVIDGAAVSAPVKNAEGKVVAALTVSLPLSRLTEDRVPALVDAVCRGAMRLSNGLGFA